MSSSWTPLSVRTGSRTGYDALAEGVPPWLHQSLMDWSLSIFEWEDQQYRSHFDPALLHQLERRLRLPQPFNWQNTQTAIGSLQHNMEIEPEIFLDVVDFALANRKDGSTSKVEQIDQLQQILEEGGSAWRVSRLGERPHLERRVDATVQAAAEQVISSSGRAGDYLQRAWEAVYGRHPDPGTAYRQAVSAVEAAARPVVMPTDATATLGKVLGEVRAASSRWVIESGAKVDQAGTLVAMMELLWKGQTDRHGSPDPAVPLTVSQPEAEAALHLAVTLVHWFASGAVRRR